MLGVSVETDFNSTAPIQRSGGYTSINDDWGFSITTLSTLFSKEEDEDWDASGIGTLQHNKMSLMRQDINILGHYHLRTGYHLFGGANYSKVSFNRHHFREGEGANKFRSEVLGPDHPFKPDDISGAISEEQVTFQVKAGVGYDSYFVDLTEGLRFNWEASIALPIYRRAINSSETVVLTEIFNEGYTVNAAVGVGWQFSKHFSVNYRAEAVYAYHAEIGDLKEDGIVLPATEMYGVANFVTAYWNF